MSEHQETLAQVVKRIDTSFDKIKQYSEKADQYRISAGKQLVELQARNHLRPEKNLFWITANFCQSPKPRFTSQGFDVINNKPPRCQHGFAIRAEGHGTPDLILQG